MCYENWWIALLYGGSFMARPDRICCVWIWYLIHSGRKYIDLNYLNIVRTKILKNTKLSQVIGSNFGFTLFFRSMGCCMQ